MLTTLALGWLGEQMASVMTELECCLVDLCVLMQMFELLFEEWFA